MSNMGNMSNINTTENRNILGVIGGLGPMSSAYFYELLTSHTKVTKDQDHIDLILSSRSSTPDRTAYILGESTDSPLPAMTADAKMLESCGAKMIVMICNTAHYFIDEIRNAITVPMPSIIEETVKYLKANGRQTPAIIATDGTLASGAYQKKLAEADLDCITPSETEQKTVMSVIYDYVKQGKDVPAGMLEGVISSLRQKGCDAVICGCTEISLAARQIGDADAVDPMEVLAYKVIKEFGKTPTGFADSFTNYIR